MRRKNPRLNCPVCGGTSRRHHRSALLGAVEKGHCRRCWEAMSAEKRAMLVARNEELKGKIRRHM